MSSIFIYGPPGSGKTTLAASFTELGLRVHFLDWDKKVKDMQNLKSRIDSGEITYQELEESLMSEPSLKQRAQEIMKYYPKKTPKGYFEISEMVDLAFKDPPEDHKRTVLVGDSFSRLNEHLKRLIKHFSKKPKLDFDGWDAILANYEEFTDTFYKHKPELYAHRVLIAHSKFETDDKGAILGITPHIDGQFKDKVGSNVEEMYYCEVELFSKQGQAKYKVLTKPVGLIKQARSSMQVKAYTDASMKLIFDEKYQQEEEEEDGSS